MRKVESYQTTDGKLFKTAEEAKIHEIAEILSRAVGDDIDYCSHIYANAVLEKWTLIKTILEKDG